MNIKLAGQLVFLLLVSCIRQTSFAQQPAAQPPPAADPAILMAPKELPGKGLAQFDFFYAGEAKNRNMYIIRQGKITWSYIDTVGRGEISDAILMKNGNVLFAHQFGITLIDREKKVLWNYDTPQGFETHTAQLIGSDHVVFVQNGTPAKVIVMNLHTNAVEKEFPLPFKSGTHGQIRHARLTDSGTLVVAHMDLGKVSEYDVNGKELLSIDVPAVWSAVPLKNGHLLVASNAGFVREMSRSGEIVWDCPLSSLSGYRVTNPQLAVRLPDGSTLVNNWFNQWSDVLKPGNAPVQAVVITPGKRVTWALRAWADPVNLGPSTTIQLLDQPVENYENVHFGNFR
jgi:hypothetical protein